MSRCDVAVVCLALSFYRLRPADGTSWSQPDRDHGGISGAQPHVPLLTSSSPSGSRLSFWRTLSWLVRCHGLWRWRDRRARWLPERTAAAAPRRAYL